MVLARFRAAAPEAKTEDLRSRTAMVAVQGPDAPAILETLLGHWPKRFNTVTFGEGEDRLWGAGTGYTGERGGELVGSPATMAPLIGRLVASGVTPCGLGSRDTLRLEAGLLLAGQDFDSTTNPYEAGLESAIAWDHGFVGRDSLEVVRKEGPGKRLVAFTLPGRQIPRHGYRLRAGASQGEVTSGNFSPMLENGIGLGYLAPPPLDDPIDVEIRGVWTRASQAEMPFYRR
jgi:aminomethyltransferase